MPRSVTAWGLDVGNTSLKAIKLRRDGQTIAIEAFDVVEHDKFLTEPDIDRDGTIRHTLQKFLERNPIKKEAVFIGVPGSSTFARFVKLPPVEPKKVPEIVRFEAIQQIPFPLDQVNWDYQTFISPESPEVEVGIFAMKKELVTQVMANFQASEMVIEGVQMAPLAVYNAAVYDEMPGGKGTVILDIGAASTDLIFVDSGRLWLRTINIGGNNFTDALAKSFKMSFSKAEALKRTAATSKYQKQIYQAMRPVFADLVAEIQRSIGFYNSGHRDSRLERIIAMGNTFKLPNLQKYIQQELKMEVVRLEHFKKANIDGKLAAGLNEHILAMTGAYGLALQGLDLATIDTNLLPIDIAREMVWSKKQPWFAAAAAVILLGVGVQWYMYHRDSAAFEDTVVEQSAHDGEIRAAKDLANKFKLISGDFKRSEDDLNFYAGLSAERHLWPMILQDIFKALPQARDPKAFTVENRNEQPVLFLTSITARPTDDLANATESTTAQPGVASAEDPNARNDRSVAGAGGGAGGGTSRDRSADAGGGKRGFFVTITGYTPYSNPHEILPKFASVLRESAPAPDPKAAKSAATGKPYYILSAASGYKAAPLTVSPFGGAGIHGPFSDVFLPALLPTPTTGPAPTLYGAAVVKPIDPDTQKEMKDYTSFTMSFKVFLKS